MTPYEKAREVLESRIQIKASRKHFDSESMSFFGSDKISKSFHKKVQHFWPRLKQELIRIRAIFSKVRTRDNVAQASATSILEGASVPTKTLHQKDPNCYWSQLLTPFQKLCSRHSGPHRDCQRERDTITDLLQSLLRPREHLSISREIEWW